MVFIILSEVDCSQFCNNPKKKKSQKEQASFTTLFSHVAKVLTLFHRVCVCVCVCARLWELYKTEDTHLDRGMQ